MKKLYIFSILLLPTIFLSGCVLDTKNETIGLENKEIINQKDFIFKKNQECLKYKSNLEKKLQKGDSPFGKTSLEQIFYSSKKNSCLYVEFSEKEMFGNQPCYNKRLLDIMNDGDSSEPIEACLSVCPYAETDLLKKLVRTDCEAFDKMVESYKL